MVLPAIHSYCLGLTVPAREPEPAQGTNAKQRAGLTSSAVLEARLELGLFTVQ